VAAKKKEEVIKFNPLVRGGRMFEHYPELSNHKEFVSNSEIEEKLIRFGILMAQPNSPVYKMLDFETRIREACKLVGITEEALIKELLLSKNFVARKAISKFFTLTNNKKMDAWYALTCSYQESCYTLAMPVDTAKDQLVAVKLKTEIRGKLIEAMRELQRLEKDLFQDDYIEGIIREEELTQTIHYAESFADASPTIV
jgi:hypothetical protein